MLKRRLEKMTMKKKLNFGFGVVVALMILIGIFNLINLGRMYSGFTYYIHDVQKANDKVASCRLSTNIIGRNVREMAINEDPGADAAYKAKIEEQKEALKELMTELHSMGVVPEDLLKRYETELTNWITIADEILIKLEAGDLQGARDDIINDCAPALQKSINTSKDIAVETDRIAQQELKKNTMSVILSVSVLFIFVLLALIMALRISNIISKMILVPIYKIIEVSKAMSSGHLRNDLDYNSEDEIGEAIQYLREAFTVLGGYMDDMVRTMTEFSNGNFNVQSQVEWKGDFVLLSDSLAAFKKSMTETVKNLQVVAVQVSSGSDQVAASSNDLAQGATDQAAITEELAATASGVMNQVAKNAENAKDISTRVNGLGENIVRGNGKMQEMVESMNEIYESSNEISKIIATINDIASQTNLLALNASIEAARAGEAGKGFAVVADQVSLLAAQSSEAAKESTTLIEGSVNAVTKGMGIASETAKHLEDIAENSRVITEEVNGIAVELEAQITAMNQIDEGILHINDVIQTNSATSEECAAASQEMNNQVNVLEEMIRSFKIEEFG